MPSVIGLLEQREARAREELESWREVLSQTQEEVAAATERAERARVAREKLVQALAEEGAGCVFVAALTGEADPFSERLSAGERHEFESWRGV
ncbi:hypothetical protein [Streptomyces brasiliensis]|nr:hypothetical protein [Streptomyces brasiliensis]